MGQLEYYDIGLNLFCRQFPDPEKIIREAAEAGVICILTGTDRKENQKITGFAIRLSPSNASRNIHKFTR